MCNGSAIDWTLALPFVYCVVFMQLDNCISRRRDQATNKKWEGCIPQRQILRCLLRRCILLLCCCCCRWGTKSAAVIAKYELQTPAPPFWKLIGPLHQSWSVPPRKTCDASVLYCRVVAVLFVVLWSEAIFPNISSPHYILHCWHVCGREEWHGWMIRWRCCSPHPFGRCPVDELRRKSNVYCWLRVMAIYL